MSTEKIRVECPAPEPDLSLAELEQHYYHTERFAAEALKEPYVISWTFNSEGEKKCYKSVLQRIQTEDHDALLQQHPKKFQQQCQIQLPPGSRMLRIAEISLSKEIYDRDCIAAMADWHEEYFEALDQDRGRVKMAAIRIRHTWGFLKAVGLLSAYLVIQKLLGRLLKQIIGAGKE